MNSTDKLLDFLPLSLVSVSSDGFRDETVEDLLRVPIRLVGLEPETDDDDATEILAPRFRSRRLFFALPMRRPLSLKFLIKAKVLCSTCSSSGLHC